MAFKYNKIKIKTMTHVPNLTIGQATNGSYRMTKSFWNIFFFILCLFTSIELKNSSQVCSIDFGSGSMPFVFISS